MILPSGPLRSSSVSAELKTCVSKSLHICNAPIIMFMPQMLVCKTISVLLFFVSASAWMECFWGLWSSQWADALLLVSRASFGWRWRAQMYFVVLNDAEDDNSFIELAENTLYRCIRCLRYEITHTGREDVYLYRPALATRYTTCQIVISINKSDFFWYIWGLLLF